ncbi:MAG TPA: glycosyl hydrolase [Candidatus Paceibacterota bacterium]|nr:glycosyl hydrolase [Candidatus Paceibacterota bacterium]
MQAIFSAWNDGFPSYAKSTVGAGKTLVIFWEQYDVTLDQIISGSQDSVITQFAAGARSYGSPIILAPFHEMNGNWDPWDGTVGSNTPAKVITAWKHLRDVFGNVSNVKFAWDVNNESVPDTSGNEIRDYYPGDAYVDYLAVDGFNFGNPWQTWEQVFSDALGQLSAISSKPIYILSMASADGSQKGAWITDGLGSAIKKYPQVAGWVWFNENKEENWLVNSTSAALAAFKSVIP